MYVCICNAITDSQVIRAVEQGVRNLRGLQAHLGMALECGRCASYAQGLLRGAAARRPKSRDAARIAAIAPVPRPRRNHERRQEDAAIPQ
jgi:bacterioferritin-associated ferredoxin